MASSYNYLRSTLNKVGKLRGWILGLIGGVLGLAALAEKIGAASQSENVRRVVGHLYAYRFDYVLAMSALVVVLLTCPSIQDLVGVARVARSDWRRGGGRRAGWIVGVLTLLGALAIIAYQFVWFWIGRDVRARVGDISFIRAADRAIGMGRRSLGRYYLESCRLSLGTDRCKGRLAEFERWDKVLEPLEALKRATPAMSMGLPGLIGAVAEIRGESGFLEKEVELASREVARLAVEVEQACETYRQDKASGAQAFRRVSGAFLGLSDADRLTLESESGGRADRGFLGAIARDGCHEVAGAIVAHQLRDLKYGSGLASRQMEENGSEVNEGLEVEP